MDGNNIGTDGYNYSSGGDNRQTNEEQVQYGYGQTQNDYQQGENGYGNGYQSNSGDYRQQSFNQQAYKQSNFNNPFNREGNFGINLMAYITIAALLVMSGSVTPLILLFVVLFIEEKDKELNKAVLTMISHLLIIMIAYDVFSIIYSPISNGVSSLLVNLYYSGSLYKFVNWLSKALSFINRTVTWIYKLSFIVIGALDLSKSRKGMLKIPKVLDKYLG